MSYDYGWWPVVALHVGLVLTFVLSYLRPARPREWRSFGVLGAFFVALYTEMYGFPLTIYLLTALLGRTPFPDPFAHNSGNLIASLLGLGEQWAGLFMLLGGIIMVLALVIVGSSWRRIHGAEGKSSSRTGRTPWRATRSTPGSCSASWERSSSGPLSPPCSWPRS